MAFITVQTDQFNKWVKLWDDKKMTTQRFKINLYPIITGDYIKWQK